MGSKKENKKHDTDKQSVELTELDLSLQDVQEEIQILQESTKDLQLMLRGMYGEIQELKKVTKRISLRIDSVFDGVVKKAPKPHIKEISSGLDYLTQIPQHLRDTFRVILKRDTGSTALDISLETGKSRSLESDYLNQLVDRGFVIKRRSGKKVLFYKIGEHEEEEDEIPKPVDHNKSLAFIAEKQMVVNNANNSHDKKPVHIHIDDK